jgi:Tfp pilus assembly protein PilF
MPKTEKHSVMPGPLAPARALYGSMLLQHDDAKEALLAFESTMRKEPNCLNAILGAAKAAAASGDSAKARQYYFAAAEMASGSGVTRSEVADAHAYRANAK